MDLLDTNIDAKNILFTMLDGSYYYYSWTLVRDISALSIYLEGVLRLLALPDPPLSFWSSLEECHFKYAMGLFLYHRQGLPQSTDHGDSSRTVFTFKSNR